MCIEGRIRQLAELKVASRPPFPFPSPLSYQDIFTFITKSRLEDHWRSELPSHLNQDDLHLMKARFHCAVYHGQFDHFCTCCTSRSPNEWRLRCEAIEVAAEYYGEVHLTDYWTALTQVRSYLLRFNVCLADIEGQVSDASRLHELNLVRKLELCKSRWKPVKGNSFRAKHGELGLAPGTPEDSNSLASDSSHASTSAFDLSREHQTPDTEVGFGLQSCQSHITTDNASKTAEDSSPLQEDSQRDHAAVNDRTKRGMKRARKRRTKLKIANQDTSTSERPRSSSDEKLIVPESSIATENPNVILSPKKAGTGHEFLLPSGELMLCEDVYEVSSKDFELSPQVRTSMLELDLCFMGMSEVRAEIEKVDKEPPSWGRNYRARCLDLLQYRVQHEQQYRASRIMKVADLTSQRLHGLTNERARLSLGQIAPEEHVEAALSRAAKAPRQARVPILRTALDALFDHTIQQFANRYHLVPEDRCQQLDAMKKSLNKAGGLYLLPCSTRRFGDGFHNLFKRLQQECAQLARVTYGTKNTTFQEEEKRKNVLQLCSESMSRENDAHHEDEIMRILLSQDVGNVSHVATSLYKRG